MNAPVDVSFFARAAKPLTSYRKYWAARFGTAPFLPMSRAEMDKLGWDSCDIVLVTGDAYVDHPSFGMAVIGRMLEAQGFRVGIIAQPDWTSAEAFKALGKPNLFWGVTAGNMDSMINRYTADRKIRSDDAYTPGDVGGKRPDRAAIVYSQRCREAFKDVPIVLGGIEGSLRRIAHYDYWSDKVRRSIVVDAHWSKWPTAWPPKSRWRRLPTCAEPPLCAAPTTKPLWAGLKLIRPTWTSPVTWRRTSTPTRPPRSRPQRRGAVAPKTKALQIQELLAQSPRGLEAKMMLNRPM
ncbi:MAG: hypothetical protein RL081_691 [Pseudomonadota bacterium]